MLAAALILAALTGSPPSEAGRGSSPAEPEKAPTLRTDRELEMLSGQLPEQLAAAADCLESGPAILLAERTVDAEFLTELARAVVRDHPTRALRERIGRAVDPVDFVRLLDDACRQKDRDDLPATLVVSPGRARNAGVFVHPSEVFADAEVAYGDAELPVDMPLDYRSLPRPEDGEPIGPKWAARYLEPEDDEAKLHQLVEANRSFGRRVAHLTRQIREQGGFVRIESAVRRRERGLLLYASFALSRAGSEDELRERISALERYNERWGLDVPIRWRHPGPWIRTVESARRLADTYGVVYATVRGARRSSHYRGDAVDVVAVGLPRTLRLEAPDGEEEVFDLSDPEHTRDLSLAPDLIAWVEAHYDLRKLERDYPHWSDGR